jgi:hypothetical protein
MSSKSFFLSITLLTFFLSSIFYFLILIQLLNFIFGVTLFGIIIFLLFWNGLLISRRSGELFGLKNKKQILIISLIISLGFSEIFWSISFLPFSFFILGGLFTVFFATVFDIMRESFKNQRNLFSEIKEKEFVKNLKKDVILGLIFIVILISISSWMPIRG